MNTIYVVMQSFNGVVMQSFNDVDMHTFNDVDMHTFNDMDIHTFNDVDMQSLTFRGDVQYPQPHRIPTPPTYLVIDDTESALTILSRSFKDRRGGLCGAFLLGVRTFLLEPFLLGGATGVAAGV